MDRLEDEKKTLLSDVTSLTEGLERQKRDQEDIYYYLNKKCDESFDVIASLEEQLRSEQADREVAEKAYEVYFIALTYFAASSHLSNS